MAAQGFPTATLPQLLITALPTVLTSPAVIGNVALSSGVSYALVKSACSISCSGLGSKQAFISLEDGGVGISVANSIFTTFLQNGLAITYTRGDTSFVAGQGQIFTLNTNAPGLPTTVDSFPLTTVNFRLDGIYINNNALKLETATAASTQVQHIVYANNQDGSSPSLTSSTAASSASSSVDTSIASTTVSATTSPAVTSHAPSNKQGVSSGAVAGVAIGCLIAGFAIAALAFICLRRRRNAQRPLREPTPARVRPAGEKGLYSTVVPVNSQAGGLFTVVANNLPQSAEDRQIEREMGVIQQRIRDHVESYYDSNKVIRLSDGSFDLAAFGKGMNISSAELISLLAKPKTRPIALCFCISWIVMSRLSLGCAPDESFLPPGVSAILQEAHEGIDNSSALRIASFSVWRALTASLLQSGHGRSPSLPIENINKALEQLEAILQPFAIRQQEDTERVGNLGEIMKRSARFGFLLFSQKGVWEFSWRSSDADLNLDRLVVFPSLAQTVNDNGERLNSPRTLVPAKTEPVNLS